MWNMVKKKIRPLSQHKCTLYYVSKKTSFVCIYMGLLSVNCTPQCPVQPDNYPVAKTKNKNIMTKTQ